VLTLELGRRVLYWVLTSLSCASHNLETTASCPGKMLTNGVLMLESDQALWGNSSNHVAVGGLHLHDETHSRTLSIKMSNGQNMQAPTFKMTRLKLRTIRYCPTLRRCHNPSEKRCDLFMFSLCSIITTITSKPCRYTLLYPCLYQCYPSTSCKSCHQLNRGTFNQPVAYSGKMPFRAQESAPDDSVLLLQGQVLQQLYPYEYGIVFLASSRYSRRRLRMPRSEELELHGQSRQLRTPRICDS
jgi:hypothetical protein